MLIRHVLAVACVLLASSAATAATVTMDLATGGDTIGSPVITGFSSGGVSGTISAYKGGNTFPGNTLLNNSVITQDGDGLGIQLDAQDNPNLDGSGSIEWLHFRFDKTVELLSVSLVRDGGNWDVWAGLGAGDQSDKVGNGSTQNPFVFASGTMADFFTIKLDGSNDDARVASFDAIAPVPLPATGLLLLGAVAGLAALRRRKLVA